MTFTDKDLVKLKEHVTNEESDDFCECTHRLSIIALLHQCHYKTWESWRLSELCLQLDGKRK